MRARRAIPSARPTSRARRGTLVLAASLATLLSGRALAQVQGTPWEGSQDQGAATPAAGDTNQVSFEFHPERSELTTPCEQIALIQTCQMFADGVPLDPGDYFDGYEYRDDDAISDLPGTRADESSTYLDHVEDDTTPYYQDSGGGIQGESNGTVVASTTTDTPRTGGGDRGFPRIADVLYKFEICAFCARGEDAGHYFGCLTWEFAKSAAEQAAGSPGTSRFTGTSDQPSEGFSAAVDRWAETHDFDLPGR